MVLGGTALGQMSKLRPEIQTSRENMIQTKGLTGAQTMLRVLGKMGVERIFASPGSEWSPLWEALAEPGVEGMPIYMSTRHEEIAVGMAATQNRRVNCRPW